MKALRRAAARFREAGSVPALALLLMLAALPAMAGERGSPANDSSDTGRHAEPRSDSGGGRSSWSPPPSPPPSSGSSGGGSSSGGSDGWTSSGGREPRTARPRTGDGDDAASRQRPRTDSRDRRGGGGDWYGGGYYGGGYHHGYYPRSYFYWGPYWGWGWGWWWDDYYLYGYGYPPYRYPYPRDRYYDRYGTMGALDTDVSPGKTEIWLDGRYVGTADDFDGFPQYLWLDRGVYDLVMFRDGYRTIARQITIRPGAVISVDDRMERGESTRPEDLATKTHERRDERIRSEEERREEIARREEERLDDWRERARRRMEERDRYERNNRDERDERHEEDDDGRAEARDGSGRLRIEVLPADASVYLDGRFVGTGIDLERLRQGLRVEPGEHRIAVVRPGHKAEEQEFTVATGEEVELEIELESME